jgi:hypothetical protein
LFVFLCTSVCVWVGGYICVYICMRVCVCVCLCVYACVSALDLIVLRTHIRTSTHVPVYTHQQKRMYPHSDTYRFTLVALFLSQLALVVTHRYLNCSPRMEHGCRRAHTLEVYFTQLPHVDRFVSLSNITHTHIYTHMHTHTLARIHTHTHTHTHTHARHNNTHSHTFTNTQTYAQTCF